MGLSKQRLDELDELGKRLSGLAEDVPLGSLAHAIGKDRDCLVCIWSFAPTQRNSDGKAILYEETLVGDATDGKLYTIFYPPSADGRGSMNAVTRFQVAHELAHIALKHPLQNRDRSPKLELEANYLAFMLLEVHGAPIGRKKLEKATATAILGKIRHQMSEEDSQFLLLAVEELVARAENGELRNHQKTNSMAVTVEQELQRFFTDQEFQDQCVRDARETLAMALGRESGS